MTRWLDEDAAALLRAGRMARLSVVRPIRHPRQKTRTQVYEVRAVSEGGAIAAFRLRHVMLGRLMEYTLLADSVPQRDRDLFALARAALVAIGMLAKGAA